MIVHVGPYYSHKAQVELWAQALAGSKPAMATGI